jgi:CheY-like chemotaxis protein
MVRVLVVDDEETLLQHLTDYLKTCPEQLDIVAATTGESATELLRGQRVDVLLTDVRLPGIDGIELVRRGLELNPRLGVLVMTAYGSPELGLTARRAGAVRFIEKPFNLDAVHDAILQCAERIDGWAGMVGGIDIFDLAQLAALSEKRKLVRVVFAGQTGVMLFCNHSLVHATCASLAGEAAFYHMAQWSGGTFQVDLDVDVSRYPANIKLPISHLLLEAARIRDERGADSGGAIAAAVPLADGALSADITPASPVDRTVLTTVRCHLREWSGVEGFLGGALLSSDGVVLEQAVGGLATPDAVWSGAKRALESVRSAGTVLGFERAGQVQIHTPEALVTVRRVAARVDGATAAAAEVLCVVAMSPQSGAGVSLMLLGRMAVEIGVAVRGDA